MRGRRTSVVSHLTDRKVQRRLPSSTRFRTCLVYPDRQRFLSNRSQIHAGLSLENQDSLSCSIPTTQRACRRIWIFRLWFGPVPKAACWAWRFIPTIRRCPKSSSATREITRVRQCAPSYRASYLMTSPHRVRLAPEPWSRSSSKLTRISITTTVAILHSVQIVCFTSASATAVMEVTRTTVRRTGAACSGHFCASTCWGRACHSLAIPTTYRPAIRISVTLNAGRVLTPTIVPRFTPGVCETRGAGVSIHQPANCGLVT